MKFKLLASALLAFSFCASAQIFGGSTQAKKVVNSTCTDGQVPIYSGGKQSGCGSGGGGGSTAVEVGGSAIGTEATINFIAGSGVSLAGADAGSKINVTASADTAVMLSRATFQGNTDRYLTGTSGTSTAYVVAPTGNPLTSYATGQHFQWLVDKASGASPTINISTLGARKLYDQTGTVQIASSQLAASSIAEIVYDATLDAAVGGFRVTNLGGSGGGIGTAGSINLSPTGTNDGVQSGAGPWRVGGAAVRVTSAITQGGIDSIQFDNSTGGNPTTYATVPVPSDWNNAGTVSFTGLIWDASGTNTSITILVNVVCAGDGDAIGVTYGTSQSVAVSNPSNSVMRAFTISPVTTTGCASGKVMGIRLSLDRASTNQSTSLRMSNMKLNYVRQ